MKPNKITPAKVAGACGFMRLVLSRLPSSRSGADRHFAQFCRWPSMRNCSSRIILATVLIVVAAFTSIAQTNRPAELVLPPADWDARTHTLASLLTTNKPGEYPLPFVWVGTEKVSARIGWYGRKEAVAEQTDQWLEFDKLTVGRQRLQPKQREDRFISAGEKVIGWAFYRTSLPFDTELLGMRDFLSVSNLFGWNPLSHATNLIGENSLWVSIRYFALRPYDAIETVQVTFMKRGMESQIDNILVKRARLHPKPKAE